MRKQPAPDPLPAWRTDALSLYQRLLPAAALESFPSQPGFRQNNRVYTCLVVMWLMMAQRLQPMASLQTAVLALLRGLPATFWPQPCKLTAALQAGRSPASACKLGARAARAYPVTPELTIRHGRPCRRRWWNKAATGFSSS